MEHTNEKAQGNKSAQVSGYAKVDVLKFFLGLALIVVAIWAFFFELHLFPTPPGVVYWWTVPNFVTISVACGYLGVCGLVFMDDFIKRYIA